MTFIDTHKNRIRLSAMQNPLKAYFLGGFETLPLSVQRQTIKFLRERNLTNEKNNTKAMG